MTIYSILSCAALLAISWQPVDSPSAPETMVRLAGDTYKIDRPEFDRLAGRWIVTSVERDGAPNQAQLGREVGDVINLNWNGGRPNAR